MRRKMEKYKEKQEKREKREKGILEDYENKR